MGDDLLGRLAAVTDEFQLVEIGRSEYLAQNFLAAWSCRSQDSAAVR